MFSKDDGNGEGGAFTEVGHVSTALSLKTVEEKKKKSWLGE